MGEYSLQQALCYTAKSYYIQFTGALEEAYELEKKTLNLYMTLLGRGASETIDTHITDHEALQGTTVRSMLRALLSLFCFSNPNLAGSTALQ